MNRRNKAGQQHGFTIIELMVATAVFATVLLVVTGGILQITRLYLKGVTTANTQNTARAVIDTVSQAIQFGGGTVVPTSDGVATPTSPKVFCIGNQRFTYTIGWQLTDDSPDATRHQSYHSLVQDNRSGCSSETTQPLNTQSVSGRELLAPNMRLSKLNVVPVGDNLYRVEVRVVYGDDDLLQEPVDGPGTTCVNESAGTQFCAISELSTVVTKRVQ